MESSKSQPKGPQNARHNQEKTNWTPPERELFPRSFGFVQVLAWVKSFHEVNPPGLCCGSARQFDWHTTHSKFYDDMQIPIIQQQKYIAFTSQNSYFPLFFFFFFYWWFKSGFSLNQVCWISKQCCHIFFRVTQIFTLTKTKVCECSCSSFYNVKANCQWLLLLAQILTLQPVRSTFLNMAIFQYSIRSKHFSFCFVNRTTKARELIDTTTGRKIDTVYEISFCFTSHL